MKNNSKLNFFVLFMICAMALAYSCTLRASEIDLDKPVTIKLGNGIAVFSITFKCAIPNPTDLLYVKWRAVDGAKMYSGDGRSGEIDTNAGALFGTEEFYKSPRHVWGRLAGLSLPQGTYEFYGFRSISGHQRGSTFLSARHEFSRRFSVEPGKAQYVGSLDICTGNAFFGGGGILSGFMIGAWVGTVEVFPSLLNEGDLDLPMLFAKGNGLNATDVLRNVTFDETDRHMQALADDLRSKSEQGDIFAQRSLMLGLLNGWAMTETGEEFKVQKNRELQRQLAEQLAAKGISSGAYTLGLLQAPLLEKYMLGQLSPDVDGQQLLNNMVADAERYFPPAMIATSIIYRSRLPGVDRNVDQASLWEKRWNDMDTLEFKSVPYLNEAGNAEFKKFNSASLPRYFALSVSGAYGMSIGDDASAKAAIAACEARNTGAAEHCRLYAKNKWVTWEACPAEYAGPQATIFPPVTGLGKVTDVLHLPTNFSDTTKARYRDFLAARMPRAFAVSDTGEAVMASGDCHAAYKALQACSVQAGKACQLYAIDDQIVLGATDPKLVEMQQRLFGIVEKEKQNAAAADIQLPPADTALASLKSQE